MDDQSARVTFGKVAVESVTDLPLGADAFRALRFGRGCFPWRRPASEVELVSGGDLVRFSSPRRSHLVEDSFAHAVCVVAAHVLQQQTGLRDQRIG